MHRARNITIGLAYHLTLEHRITHLYQRFSAIADVLMHGYDKARRQGHGRDRTRGRFLLVLRRVHAAVKFMELPHQVRFMEYTGYFHFQFAMSS